MVTALNSGAWDPELKVTKESLLLMQFRNLCPKCPNLLTLSFCAVSLANSRPGLSQDKGLEMWVAGCSEVKSHLKTFGGTPNRDPCSLWGLIWGHPRDIGLYHDYIRVMYGNGIKGPY